MKRLLILIWLGLLFCTTVIAATPLPEGQVFQVSATIRDPQTTLFTWQIKPGYFLYRHAFHFQVISPTNVEPSPPLYPPNTLTKTYPHLGTFDVYAETVTIALPILAPPQDTLVINVSYQGCSEEGFCYPPTTKQFHLTPNTGPYGQSIQPQTTTAPETPATTTPPQSTTTVWSQLYTLLVYFGIGILMAFTPCVLPMVPILSGILVGHAKHHKKNRAFGLAVSYVLGMALFYAIAGLLATWLGTTIQAYMQQPAVLIGLAIFLVFLAGGLFDWYQLQASQSWLTRATQWSSRFASGHYIGSFMMGCLSSIILSPCVTPALVGVLTFIGQTGQIWLGGITLFVLGLGMGVPLLIMGLAGQKYLPKAGNWMTTIKHLLGFVLLGLGIFVIDRLLPDTLIMVLWGVFALGIAFYFLCHTRAAFKHKSITAILCLIATVYAVWLFVGAAQGHRNPLLPWSQPAATLSFTTVGSPAELQQQLAIAQQKNQYTLVDFYATWCLSCQILEHHTFPDARVAPILQKIHRIRIDITRPQAGTQALQKQFNVIAPPVLLFFNPQGQLIPDSQIVGEITAEQLADHLQKIGITTDPTGQ